MEEVKIRFLSKLVSICAFFIVPAVFSCCPGEADDTDSLVDFSKNEQHLEAGKNNKDSQTEEKSVGVESVRDVRCESVILIMVDTMRADLYPFAKSGRKTGFEVPMPNLVSFSKKSFVFTNATSHASYTKPSVATMLTGLYPSVNGALGRKSPVRKTLRLITEYLAEAGIPSVGIFSNYFFRPQFGLSRGWRERVWVRPYRASIDDGVVVSALKSKIDEIKKLGRFFLYVHLMGGHAPYAPPVYARVAISKGLLRGVIAPVKTAELLTKFRQKKIGAIGKETLRELKLLYRADGFYHDKIFGEIMEVLIQSGLAEGSLIIYTSDHGEEFLEHGNLGHGNSLWSEQTSVPMIMHLPGQSDGREIEALVGHIDIAPTIISAFGLDVPRYMEGIPLLNFLSHNGQERNAFRVLLLQHWKGFSAVRSRRWKLTIENKSRIVLTEMKNNWGMVVERGEQEAIYEVLMLKRKQLISHIAQKIEGMNIGGLPHEEVVIDNELKVRLKKLGYVFE